MIGRRIDDWPAWAPWDWDGSPRVLWAAKRRMNQRQCSAYLSKQRAAVAKFNRTRSDLKRQPLRARSLLVKSWVNGQWHVHFGTVAHV